MLSLDKIIMVDMKNSVIDKEKSDPENDHYVFKKKVVF